MTPAFRHSPLIAVCGAGHCDTSLATCAATVGRLLAEAGAVVVCGGLGGVMAAVCQGVASAGGLSIGFLPGEDSTAANPDVGIALATGLGEGRNLLIVRSCAAVIAIGGEYGTLSEIALARKLGRTVIGMQTWDLGQAPGGEPHIIPAATPEAAVAAALAAARPAVIER